ncbi:MAG: ABC transporter ATP-binding protein [Gammaproteobacteria bacterium]|jgi:lipoprotein-releasing system ATP-binding protein|nr:MAG: lipoprotein-releasing system ATP-binding protein LolD [Gammaproteobacteria bacterium]
MNKIKIIELTKNYQSNKQNQLVLDNLNAEINLTGLTSLQGKSGSGKSTLMHILSGLLKPTSGRVLVNEIEIYKTKPIERSSLISFVYQFHALLENLSVYENIYLPRKIHKNNGSDEFINDLINQCKLEKLLKKYPSELSGGEKQRVSIVRALSNKPKCVLLDEPTGNLDDETSSSVQEMCLDINKAFNIGMFVATHDRGFASKMQYQYKIEQKSLMVIND